LAATKDLKLDTVTAVYNLGDFQTSTWRAM